MQARHLRLSFSRCAASAGEGGLGFASWLLSKLSSGYLGFDLPWSSKAASCCAALESAADFLVALLVGAVFFLTGSIGRLFSAVLF